MSLTRAPLEHDPNATTPWYAPLIMFVAWLVQRLDSIARLKRIRRTTRFASTWADHWPKLRQAEWIVHQFRAIGAAQFLAGREIDLEDFDLSRHPPDDFGGPCPTHPLDMNRRVLFIARFNVDMERYIRRHAARIAKRERIDMSVRFAAGPLRHAAHATSPAFGGGGLPLASLPVSSLAARRGRWLVASSRQDGGGCVRPCARGPPLNQCPGLTPHPPR